MRILLWLLSLNLSVAFCTEVQAESLLPDESAPVFANYGTRRMDVTYRLSRGLSSIRYFLNPDDGSLVYLADDFTGSFLFRVEQKQDGSWDSTNATKIFNVGKRSFNRSVINPVNKAFYLVSDNYNDETFNTYRVDFKTGKFEPATNFAYSPVFWFNAKYDAVFNVARMDKAGTDECLYSTPLTAEIVSKKIFCNDGDLKLYQYERVFQDPTSGAIAAVLYLKGDRSQLNLAIFNDTESAPKIVTDTSLKRSNLITIGWYQESFYFAANNGSDSTKIYAYSPKQEQITLVVAHESIQSSVGVNLDAKNGVLVFSGRSKDDAIGKTLTVNLQSGEQNVYDTNDIALSLGSTATFLPDGTFIAPGKDRKDGSRLLLFSLNPSKKADGIKIVFEVMGSNAPPPACDAKQIVYPTFDTDPVTGRTREIQAILFTPKQAPTKNAGLVYAHGGPSSRTTITGNSDIDFLCSLGYTVLAPNPRGSTGQGQEFEDLNNGDWGGGDYKDYEFGRRFLLETQKIESTRVGIFGGSFGGYMTNWAMVQPGNEFGFGISNYGMADLLEQMKFSVVPGNTTSDLGDPKKNEALYIERSPITHVKNINKPFLLTTGSRDFRSYYGDTRNFVNQLKKYSDKVEYLELEGEGHGYRYPDTLYQYYQKLADFLFRVAPTE